MRTSYSILSLAFVGTGATNQAEKNPPPILTLPFPGATFRVPGIVTNWAVCEGRGRVQCCADTLG